MFNSHKVTSSTTSSSPHRDNTVNSNKSKNDCNQDQEMQDIHNNNNNHNFSNIHGSPSPNVLIAANNGNVRNTFYSGFNDINGSNLMDEDGDNTFNVNS